MTYQDPILIRKANLAFQNVLAYMPHLAGLVQLIDLRLDERISTAGIFASGKLLYNPHWLEELSNRDVSFILAHELMHLILSSHSRGMGEDSQIVNIAHDVIINHKLEKVFGFKTPAGGLRYDYLFTWEDKQKHFKIENASLEEIVQLLKKEHINKFLQNRKCWFRSPKTKINNGNNSQLEEALKDILNNEALNNTTQNPQTNNNNEDMFSDVLTEKLELKLFPSETIKKLELKKSQLQNKVWETISLETIQEKIINSLSNQGKGNSPGNQSYTYQALKNHFAPPWQWAMQQWMESTAPSQRTYSRPSRRGQHKNFVRPGKLRIGYTLHIVLDTSGSMDHVIPKALAVIGSFCKNMNITTIHLIQSDTEVTSDDWVDIGDLDNYEIKGFGGSDMSSAMYLLAEDPEVERIIVITDGDIGYPASPLPYETLWVLTGGSNYGYEYFKPGYGKIITIDD